MIITLTTDFGSGSGYVAVMKGVILSINPAVTLVDITHDVPPQNVQSAALVLDDVAPWFPDGTIHLVVVDPGVGTQRAIVYARIGPHHYIAPDNGVLSHLSDRTPPSKLLRVQNPEYWLQPVSNTFHGRDIMAPVAARLSLGLEPELLGPPLVEPTLLETPQARVGPHRIEGIVQAIDSFGNLISNVTAPMLAGRPTDRRVCIACNIYETWGIYRAYAEQPQGALIALVGSSGRLELALVGDNAAERLGIGVGAPLVLAWE